MGVHDEVVHDHDVRAVHSVEVGALDVEGTMPAKPPTKTGVPSLRPQTSQDVPSVVRRKRSTSRPCTTLPLIDATSAPVGSKVGDRVGCCRRRADDRPHPATVDRDRPSPRPHGVRVELDPCLDEARRLRWPPLCPPCCSSALPRSTNPYTS